MTENTATTPISAYERLAEALAFVAHRDQVRKGSGEPYINHCYRVRDLVEKRGWHARSVALMHDVVEDTDVTLDALRLIGMPAAIVDDVDALSRRGGHGKGESYAEFIARTCRDGSDDCLFVKLADVADNSTDLGIHLPSGMVKRYSRARTSILETMEERGIEV